MSLSKSRAHFEDEPFRHEALFYAGEAEFVDATASFIHDGLAAGEPTLVAVVPPKIDVLKSPMGPSADGVLFADMAEIGRNPARIIPIWREFVDRHAEKGRSVRGIGEPIWAARTPEELVESQRHESLLNLALAGDPAWILCPYDTASLGRSVLDEAEKSHPFVRHGGVAEGSSTCLNQDEWAAPFDKPLSQTPEDASSTIVEEGDLSRMRAMVFGQAVRTGLKRSKADDLVIAVNEVATNSIRHGGGRGTLKLWNDGSSIVCEVRDEARIDKPMIGRERPSAGQEGGFGLWLVNQLCDLVQIRTFEDGSVVRMHMRLP